MPGRGGRSPGGGFFRRTGGSDAFRRDFLHGFQGLAFVLREFFRLGAALVVEFRLAAFDRFLRGFGAAQGLVGALLEDLVDGIEQREPQFVHLVVEGGKFPALVPGLPEFPLPVVEIPVQVDAETEEHRRPDGGNVVPEFLGEVLDAAGGHGVAVDVEQEGEDLDLVVADDAPHGHVGDLVACLVAEFQHLPELVKIFAAIQDQVLPVDLDDAVQGRHPQRHILFQGRRRRHLAVEQALEGLEHREDAVHGGEETDYLFRGDVRQCQVESCLEVIARLGGVESFKESFPHVGHRHGVGHLEAASFRDDVRGKPGCLKLSVLERVGLDGHLGVQVGGDDEGGDLRNRGFPVGVAQDVLHVFLVGDAVQGGGHALGDEGASRGSGAQQLVHVDPVGPQRGVQRQFPAPGQRALQAGERTGDGQVGTPAPDLPAGDVHPVVREFRLQGGEGVLQRKIRRDHRPGGSLEAAGSSAVVSGMPNMVSGSCIATLSRITLLRYFTHKVK